MLSSFFKPGFFAKSELNNKINIHETGVKKIASTFDTIKNMGLFVKTLTYN